MTTKVLIANFGPDPVLVRAVDYGPSQQQAGIPPVVLEDCTIGVHESQEFWVHSQQQLLVGEKRS